MGAEEKKLEAMAKFLLRPFRLVRDPVHGDIWLSRLESTIVDQPLFQRLRGIRQLAVSHLVYPGAVHTRFEHSLGVLYLADKIAREAQKNCGSRGYLSDIDGFYLIREHDRLLIRLTALLHDAAHVPFGHLIEDEAGFTQNKQWADEGRKQYLSEHLIEKSFNVFLQNLKSQLEQGTVEEKGAGVCGSSCRHDFNRLGKELLSKSELEKTDRDALIGQIEGFLKDKVQPELLSVLDAEEKGEESIQALDKPFIGEVVGNTICADLLDYLARDAYFTGIDERYDRRIFTYFVTFKDQNDKPRSGLLIKKGSKGVRVDAARYIAKLLDMRYALAQMVYTHPAKRMFSALVSSMFGSWAMNELLKSKSNKGAFFSDLSDDTAFAFNLQKVVGDLVLKMTEKSQYNTDDALLTTLVMLMDEELDKQKAQTQVLLDTARVPPSLGEQEWNRRAAFLARIVKHREKWKRIRLENYNIELADRGSTGEIRVSYKNPNVNKKLTGLKNLTGTWRMRIEEELERLLRGLYFLKMQEEFPSPALIALHVPKVFKPKEADVNVVLVHDGGASREAYAGPFKYLKKEGWREIKRIKGKGSLEESDFLGKEVQLLGPMLGILDSIADATVKLTIAEYYLHPKISELLREIDAEQEFTEVVEIMVALRRSLEKGDNGKLEYQSESVEEYYMRYKELIEILAQKVGAKCDFNSDSKQLAAHEGKSQPPINLRPANFIKYN